MHPQSSIQQSPGPTSVKASAAAASPLALHPPLPPLHTLSRCPASWAGTNSPQSPQSKGGWARVVVWGGQPQQAGRALRLPSGRAPRLRAAAAPPQGSGGPAEDPQPPSASPGSLLPSRPSPRPAGRALPPKRRVNAAAIPSRHRSPLTSLQTSPLRQGLPLPPPRRNHHGNQPRAAAGCAPGRRRRRQGRRWRAATAARPAPRRPFSTPPGGPVWRRETGRPGPRLGKSGQPGAPRGCSGEGVTGTSRGAGPALTWCWTGPVCLLLLSSKEHGHLGRGGREGCSRPGTFHLCAVAQVQALKIEGLGEVGAPEVGYASAGSDSGMWSQAQGFILSVHLQEEDFQMKSSPEASHVASCSPSNTWWSSPTLVAPLRRFMFW